MSQKTAANFTLLSNTGKNWPPSIDDIVNKSSLLIDRSLLIHIEKFDLPMPNIKTPNEFRSHDLN